MYQIHFTIRAAVAVKVFCCSCLSLSLLNLLNAACALSHRYEVLLHQWEGLWLESYFQEELLPRRCSVLRPRCLLHPLYPHNTIKSHSLLISLSFQGSTLRVTQQTLWRRSRSFSTAVPRLHSYKWVGENQTLTDSNRSRVYYEVVQIV